MTKRAAGAFLWFAAVSFGYEIIWSVTDVPRLLGPVFAATVATIVTFDPAGVVWRTRERSQNSRRRFADPGVDRG